MEFQRPHHYCLFLALFALLSYSQAYVFYAGGRDGWVLNPSEPYNHWAERNRFQVNDTIVFKYKKGSNSVLVVNKDDYDKCNTKNPIKKFEDGDTQFMFDRSGPFFFISGDYGNCEKGQKLIVVVLAVRGPKPQHPPPPPSVSPSPVSHPPVSQPPWPAPGLSPSSPSPAILPPATSPAPSNAPSYPTPAPGTQPPSPSPSSSAPSPATITPPLASPPSPPAATPGSSQTPPVSPGGSATPSSSNETAPSPPNGRSYAWSVTPSSLLVYSVTIVLGAVLSGILGAQ